ncbi:hypothetical protein M9H77_26872 [Catharanthus roseus]|uniref:Uncharacterized protein n=1 Tax=Catharanthus roseus TaxID=4058 RepID=A0ACC0AD21_CATRO|nr:hypothetical protein M9H77_26872 [Catharanthus roseus]
MKFTFPVGNNEANYEALLATLPQAGRFKQIARNNHLMVAIDHFTKCVEVKALASIATKKVKDFFYKEPYLLYTTLTTLSLTSLISALSPHSSHHSSSSSASSFATAATVVEQLQLLPPSVCTVPAFALGSVLPYSQTLVILSILGMMTIILLRVLQSLQLHLQRKIDETNRSKRKKNRKMSYGYGYTQTLLWTLEGRDPGPGFTIRVRIWVWRYPEGLDPFTGLVRYPQANGATEVANRTILQGLKRRLCSCKSNWFEELPNVLWSYRTTPRRAIGESPFILCFKVEPLIPTELGFTSLRNEAIDKNVNNQLMEECFVLLDENQSKRNIERIAIQKSNFGIS